MRQSLLMDHRDRSRPSPRPTAPDLTSMWREATTGWFDAVDSLVDAVAWQRPSVSAERCRCGSPHRCSCDSWCSCDSRCSCDSCCSWSDERGCGAQPCHCRCCIGDADLVIYAKLGEVRVVPVRIENPRRRQREIRLELSDFSGGGRGVVDIEGRIVSDSTFTIEACDDHIVTLVVRVGHVNNTTPSTGEVPLRGDHDDRDVEGCLVAYADLRVDGCDIRPVRIAVAVVPRDCDTFDVECGCGCC